MGWQLRRRHLAGGHATSVHLAVQQVMVLLLVRVTIGLGLRLGLGLGLALACSA